MYGILVNRPYEMSPLPEYQPYTMVKIKTVDAAAHSVVHLNFSRLEAIQVPRVWTLSFAMTEKPARVNPMMVKSSVMPSNGDAKFPLEPKLPLDYMLSLC